MNILITGGCGFIGSNFIRRVIDKEEIHSIYNFDITNYASNESYLYDLEDHHKYTLFKADIRSKSDVMEVLREHWINKVVNFAAQTHVDNSIKDPESFVTTNVNGTFNLLECCREYWGDELDYKRFVHVSTDEVYGALELNDESFTLNTPYKPNSPYSATKAASDHLCRAYSKTFNFPVIVTNCCNNYGPNQHSEKLIPLTINRLLSRQNIPVYGTGNNIREWIYVDDHCDAIWEVLTKSEPGKQYLIGSGLELTNLELVQMLCDLFDKTTNRTVGESRELIKFVKDRPGHDFRYSVDSSQIRNDLNWNAKVNFEEGLQKTLEWYLKKV
jgi:dTDP-glucose 4,6-dehydratase